MQNNLTAFRPTYLQLILKKLYPRYTQVIKNELSEFIALESQIRKAYVTQSTSTKELASIKQSVLAHTEGLWTQNNPEIFSLFANDFIAEVFTEIGKFPQSEKLEQKPERFKRQESDSSIISIFKIFKRFFWLCSQIPKRIFSKKVKYWQHQVPTQNILQEYLLHQISRQALPLLVPHYETLMKAYIELYNWETDHKTPEHKSDKLEISERLSKETAKNRRALRKQLITQSTLLFSEMEQAMDKVGTIELSTNKFKQADIDKKIKNIDSTWAENEKGWNNTFDVFLDSWRSELTLQMLMLQVQESLKVFLDSQSENIHVYVGKELDGIDEFIDETTEQINTADKELPSVLKTSIYKAQKLLDQALIPTLLEKIGNKNLVNGIARLESSTMRELEELSTERKTSKVPTDYLKPLEDEDITMTSPYDLVAFETVPILKEQFGEIKARLIVALNENLQATQDIDHMISYGLTASLDEYEAHQDYSRSTDVALESLKRSAARVKDIRDSLQLGIQAANDSIAQAVEAYRHSLDQLTKTENIREMRLRIIKAKAVQSAEDYKDEFRDKIRKTYQNLLTQTKEKFSFLVELKDRLTRQFNLHAGDEVDIEVANFLIDSENIMESLPLIYRNLYQISPVTDQELFVGREKELSQLSEAYQHWTNNKKGAVAIIGEKWSGLTSLVNHIEKGDYINYRCNRFKAKTSRHTNKELISFFGEVMGQQLKEDISWSELSTFFNSGTKKVIIIEDMHCLYLRRIGGFEVLMGLSELIQSTSGHIFWVVTCNLYIWRYFQRTVQLDEFFRYHIELQPPTEEEIEKLILKRNRISGYKPYFKGTENLMKSKKFLNSSEPEQQQLLKEKFFKDLIKYSASNISMALMFYLLSTEEIKDDRIEISEFKKPDLAFLSALDMDKVTSLHLLILHDGLTIDQFSELARIPIQMSKLLIGSMYEDGILLKKEEYFVVNPIIYRSVISLLTAKNLL